MGSNQNADASNGGATSSAESGTAGGAASSAAAAATKRNSYQINKKMCYFFVFVAAFVCFIVGVVVYHLAHLDCKEVAGVGNGGADSQTGGDGGGKKKQKVIL